MHIARQERNYKWNKQKLKTPKPKQCILCTEFEKRDLLMKLCLRRGEDYLRQREFLCNEVALSEEDY